MAKDEIQNGQAEYGIRHVMEEEMRAAGQGVFEESSSEAGQKRRRKAATASPETKMEAAPENKAADSKVISAKSMTTKSANNPTAKKRAKK
jgi:hypothetical protein